MSYYNKAVWDRLAAMSRAKHAQAFDREPFAPPAGAGPDFDAIADQAQRLYRSQMDGQLHGYEAKLLYAELAESVGGTYDQLMEWMFGAKNAKQAQFDGPGFAPPKGVDFGHGELEIVGHEGDLSNSTGPWKFFLNDGRVAIIDDSRSAPYIEGSDEQFYDEEDPNSDALPFNEALDIYLSTRANKNANRRQAADLPEMFPEPPDEPWEKEQFDDGPIEPDFTLDTTVWGHQVSFTFAPEEREGADITVDGKLVNYEELCAALGMPGTDGYEIYQMLENMAREKWSTTKQAQFKGFTPSKWFEVTEGEFQDWIVVRGTINGEPIDVLFDPSDRGEVGGYMKNGEIVEQCPPEWETDIDPIAQQFLMRHTAQFNPTPDQQMDSAQFQDWQIEETSTLGTCESCLMDGPVSDVGGRDLCKYCKVEQGMGSQFQPAMEQAMGQHMGRKAQVGSLVGECQEAFNYLMNNEGDMASIGPDGSYIVMTPVVDATAMTTGVEVGHATDRSPRIYSAQYDEFDAEACAEAVAQALGGAGRQAQLGFDPDSTYNSGWEEEVNEAEFPGGIEQQERLEPGMSVHEGPMPSAPRVVGVKQMYEAGDIVQGDIVTIPTVFEVQFSVPEYEGYGTYEATRTDLYQIENYGSYIQYDTENPVQTIYTIDRFLGSGSNRGWEMWLGKHNGANGRRPYEAEIYNDLAEIWEAYMESEKANEAKHYDHTRQIPTPPEE